MRALILAALLAGCHDLDEIRALPPAPDATCAADQIRVAGRCQPEPPSCKGTPRTCGTDGNASCCVYDLVDTGADANRVFERSWDKSDADRQEDRPVVGFQKRGQAQAIVSPFYLDRYEVTVGRFRKLYDRYDEWLINNPIAGAGKSTRSTKYVWQDSWKNPIYMAIDRATLDATIKARCGQEIVDRLRDPSGKSDRLPMTCLSWYEAFLFCIYDGARLPTEAEWNYAAAGGSQQRPYPWSMGGELSADASFAHVGAAGGEDALKEVGSLPKGAGLFGQLDLAGNAYEWVYDRCGSSCASYRSNGETDPVEVEDLALIVRGGSFRFPWRHARTSYRMNEGITNDTDGRFADVGVRCARNGP